MGRSLVLLAFASLLPMRETAGRQATAESPLETVAAAPGPHLPGGAQLATLFPEYKFSGPPPAPLRQAVEDWSAARARLTSDPAMAGWIKRVQGRATDWMRRFGDRAEWVAGWGHDLVGTDGRPIVWRWDMPEPTSGTAVHDAWVAYRRDANIATVQDAARLYRLTGSDADRDWAAAQLDFYAANYGRWPLQTRDGRSRLMGQSLDEATAAIRLAEAARLLDAVVSPQRRQQWDEELFRPMLANIQASNRGVNNIALWQAAAAGILSLRLGLDAAYARAVNGPGGVRAMLARGVTPDLLWFEPSVGYGAYAQGALATLFLATSLAEREGPLREAMLTTQAMLISQASMRFADGTLPVTGDTVRGTPAFEPSLLSLTQQTMPIRAGKLPPSWAALLDPDLPSAPPPAETRSRLWPWSQVAMLRQSGWELFFRYGQRNSSHAQLDALSYELRYRGVPVVGPAGVAAYGSTLFRDYLRQSVAHDMPLVDGQGQQRFGIGRLVSYAPGQIAAEHPAFSGGTVVTRTLAVNRNGLREETAFRVPGGRERRMGSVFNTPCLVEPAVPSSPTSTPPGLGTSWWHQVRSTAKASRWPATLACGQTQFEFVIEADRPGRVFTAQAPDGTGALTRTAIYFETIARDLVLTVRIVPR